MNDARDDSLSEAETPAWSGILDKRGTTRVLEGHVVACAVAEDGTTAFATGEGRLHVLSGGVWRDVEVHDGAILALAVDPRDDGSFITGGDDGTLRRTSPGVDPATIDSFGGRWVDAVATRRDGRTPLLAASFGKRARIYGAGDAELRTIDYPSTVTGLAFDARGKKIAASHYNGATISFVNSRADTPRVLEWKGSHIGVAFHPAGEALVTAMQENALHGWRLPDGHNMRMSGYPAKTHSLSFARNGKYLASSGADAIVLWPFFGGGPMGKAPLELAPSGGPICTRCAYHPTGEIVAGGYADGSVVLVDVATERVLPVSGPGNGPVSSLAWAPDGAALTYGTELGFAASVDLSKR